MRVLILYNFNNENIRSKKMITNKQEDKKNQETKANNRKYGMGSILSLRFRF